jgi:hypothetical protein
MQPEGATTSNAKMATESLILMSSARVLAESSGRVSSTHVFSRPDELKLLQSQSASTGAEPTEIGSIATALFRSNTLRLYFEHTHLASDH